MVLLQLRREARCHVGILQLPGYLEEAPAISSGVLGSEGDRAKGLKEVEEQHIDVLHPMRDGDAKGVGGLCIWGLKEVDIVEGETQPLIPGVMGQKLLQCGVVKLPLYLARESVLKG